MEDKKHIPNPTGKGGFIDNPQNRANGRWSKETSISFQMNRLGRMNIDEFEKFKPSTYFEKVAYNAVKESTTELGYLKELADRTEGKAQQTLEHNINEIKPIETKRV